MVIISMASSIATLILFIFYWIGRIWTAAIDSKYPDLSISVDYDSTTEKYDSFDIDCNDGDVVLITFPQNIRKLCLLETSWNSTDNCFEKGKKIAICEHIPSGRTITIHTLVPETIPNQMIEFEYSTGYRGIFTIAFDGRVNGKGVCASNLVLKTTKKSFLYYLLR